MTLALQGELLMELLAPFLCSSLLDLQATQYPLQMNLEIEKKLVY